MGFTKVEIQSGRMVDRNGNIVFEGTARQEVLVDTGATYSTLPASFLRQCDIPAEREVSLRLADGRLVKRPLGYAWMVVEGIKIQTPVLFGEAGDPPLLGVIALEDANLSVDPVARQLLKGTAYIQY